MDWMGRRSRLSYYCQSFLLLSSALRARFGIGSDILSNTCKLYEEKSYLSRLGHRVLLA
jgi:hypothetical protein